jgi:hypothetical protein
MSNKKVYYYNNNLIIMILCSILVITMLVLIVILLSWYAYIHHHIENYINNDEVLNSNMYTIWNNENTRMNNSYCTVPLQNNGRFRFQVGDKMLDWFGVPDDPQTCAIDVSSLDIGNNAANCSSGNPILNDPKIVDKVYFNDFDTNKRCEVKFKRNLTSQQMNQYMQKQRSFQEAASHQQALRQVFELTQERTRLNEQIRVAQAKADADRKTIESIQQQMQTATNRINELTRQQQQADTNLRNAQNRIAEITTSRNSNTQQLAQLRNLLTSVSGRERDIVQSQISVLENAVSLENQRLQQERAARDREQELRNQLAQQVRDSNDRINSQQNQINNLNRTITSSEQQQRALSNRIATAESTISQLRSQPPPAPVIIQVPKLVAATPRLIVSNSTAPPPLPPPPAPPRPLAACQRPGGWCAHPGSSYFLVDCIGDGVRGDHICWDNAGNRGSILRSNRCQSVWPQPSLSCPNSRIPFAPGSSISSGNTLNSPNFIPTNGAIRSGRGHRFVMQADAHIVLYNSANKPLWASGTMNKTKATPFKLYMQPDGNLVAYDNKNAVIWASGTSGRGETPYRFVMQDDGNAVIYDRNNTAIWHTNTWNR